jgi:integrase
MKGANFLNDLQIKSILDGFKDKYASRYKAILVLGMTSGLRISELLSLKYSDVFDVNDKVKNVISIEKKNVKMKIEGTTFYVHNLAKKYLLEYQKTMKDKSSYLFLSQRGYKLDVSCINKKFQEIKKQFKIEGQISTHSMRKTFAKKVYEKFNADLFKCQQALRHKNINSTVSYISVEREKLAREITQIRF